MSRAVRIAILGGVAVVLLAGAAVLYRFDPLGGHAFYPRCMLEHFTGWLCAGCGTTRALHALLHLEIRQAFAWNALSVIALPLVGVWSVRFAWRWVNARPATAFTLPVWTIWALLIVLMGFSVLRNLEPFAILAPHAL